MLPLLKQKLLPSRRTNSSQSATNSTPETKTEWPLRLLKLCGNFERPSTLPKSRNFESIALSLNIKALCLGGTRALRTRNCPPSAPFNYCLCMCSPLREEPSITAQRQQRRPGLRGEDELLFFGFELNHQQRGFQRSSQYIFLPVQLFADRKTLAIAVKSHSSQFVVKHYGKILLWSFCHFQI